MNGIYSNEGGFTLFPSASPDPVESLVEYVVDFAKFTSFLDDSGEALDYDSMIRVVSCIDH